MAELGTSAHGDVPRRIATTADEFLDSFRVVVLHGPRQAGKTTLMRQLARERGGELRNLDDAAMLAAARQDPAAFVASESSPVYIDEVQRGGDELVRAVKVAVDASARRGQFVLAGSTRFLAVPSLQESLAGRAGLLEVWPFSQGELRGAGDRFLDVAFGDPDVLRSRRSYDYTRADYLDTVVRGGFPEPSRMHSERARTAWFENYIQAVTERDIRGMAKIREPSAAGSVLRGVASMSGQLLVTTTLATRADLARATVDRYMGLLDATFLVHRLPSWSRNLLRRAVAHPKVHVVDTGLLAHLLDATAASLAQPGAPALGQIIETFVVNEITKQATWADRRVRQYHYRDGRGHGEIDLILEDERGRVVGVEAKASSTVTNADFKDLRVLQARLADDFAHGFVVYLGRHALSFGPGLTAIPLAALWDSP